MKIIITVSFAILASLGLWTTTGAATDVPDRIDTGVQRAIQKRDFDQAIALVRPYADRGDKDAEFSTAVLYILKAYVLRAEQKRSPDISKFESAAIQWLKKAARHGNEEAAGLYADVRKRGTDALYFISIEHLLDDPRPTDSKLYRRREPKPERQKPRK
jgi:hypothetical protein